MKIEYIPVRELRPYPNNARRHSKKQIQQIANSIAKFGFCNPVLIDDAKQIIAGHGRVEAAKVLGIDAVPTCRLSHLSEADKRAYILADNKLAEKAGWDRELLAIELEGLIEIDVDIEVTGFEMAEIDLILEEAREASATASGPVGARMLTRSRGHANRRSVAARSTSPAVRGRPRQRRLRSPARSRQGGIRVHRSAIQRRDRWECLRPRPRSSPRIRHGLWRDGRGGIHGIP
jgi:ParB-like chromosome segregation protein Spo0J